MIKLNLNFKNMKQKGQVENTWEAGVSWGWEGGVKRGNAEGDGEES